VPKDSALGDRNVPPFQILRKRLRTPDSAKRKEWPRADFAHRRNLLVAVTLAKSEQSRLRVEGLLGVDFGRLGLPRHHQQVGSRPGAYGLAQPPRREEPLAPELF